MGRVAGALGATAGDAAVAVFSPAEDMATVAKVPALAAETANTRPVTAGRRVRKTLPNIVKESLTGNYLAF